MLLESLCCHQLSDSALAEWVVNPAPALESLEFSLPSDTPSGGFYLSALAPAETGWEDSGLSCACGDGRAWGVSRQICSVLI